MYVCLCFVCKTQEKCEDGCSAGSPGVPGLAGAKGEKGDQGKPGVTPLDSCDRVSLQRDVSVVELGLASKYDSPPQPESCAAAPCLPTVFVVVL